MDTVRELTENGTAAKPGADEGKVIQFHNVKFYTTTLLTLRTAKSSRECKI